MRRRRFLRSASAVVLGTVGIAGCGSPAPGADDDGEGEGDGDGDEPTGNVGTTTGDVEGMIGETPEGLSVSGAELQQGDEGARVTGTVENVGESAVETVEVQVTLFASEEEIIGQHYDNTEEAEVSSLEPGRQWEFSVDIPAEDIEGTTTYRVDVDREIDQNVNVDDDFES